MEKCTFSILAKCHQTGRFGAAIATHQPGFGAFSPHVQEDVGVIVSQGWVNPLLGHKGLNFLKSGKTANQTLIKLLSDDPGRELRQLAIIDRFGNASAYTGIENSDYKNHLIGEECVILGHSLSNSEVLEAMLDSFQTSVGPIELRLLKALEKGDQLEDKKSDRKSAVLKVEAISGIPYVDFRVDDHSDPVQELSRIYEANKSSFISQYYEWVDTIKQGIKW